LKQKPGGGLKSGKERLNCEKKDKREWIPGIKVFAAVAVLSLKALNAVFPDFVSIRRGSLWLGGRLARRLSTIYPYSPATYPASLAPKNACFIGKCQVMSPLF